MIIEQETRQRFVDMLANHEIVAVGCKTDKRSNSYHYKFIGVRNGLKWDFTPCIVSESRPVVDVVNCSAITSRAPECYIELVLKSFRQNHGIKCDLAIADNITCFYM